jgi:hypothetical protein
MSKRWLGVLGAFVLAVSGLIAPPAGAAIERCLDWAPVDPPSRSYVVPDVSAHGPGAYVSRLTLFDGHESYVYERPAGTILSPQGGNLWWSAEVCVVVPPDQPPVGELLLTKVDGALVGLFGYAYDVDTPGPTKVRLQIDGRLQPQTWYADRPWVSTPTFAPEATDRSYLILVPDVPPGEHQFCVYLEPIGAMDVPDACARLVVK